MIKTIDYPFLAETVSALRVGDRVRLSGRVYTGRDRLHKHLFDDGAPPVDFTNAAIYHCGPVVLMDRGKRSVRAAGPTTSMREEPYMAALIERLGIRVIIGKGGMGAGTLKACQTFGCVYLQAVGGAASVLASCVEEVVDVHFLEEFGSAEALWVFQVRDFNAVVTMDTQGQSVHDQVRESSRAALAALRA